MGRCAAEARFVDDRRLPVRLQSARSMRGTALASLDAGCSVSASLMKSGPSTGHKAAQQRSGARLDVPSFRACGAALRFNERFARVIATYSSRVCSFALRAAMSRLQIAVQRRRLRYRQWRAREPSTDRLPSPHARGKSSHRSSGSRSRFRRAIERRQKDVIELQSLGAMNRHHLHGIGVAARGSAKRSATSASTSCGPRHSPRAVALAQRGEESTRMREIFRAHRHRARTKAQPHRLRAIPRAPCDRVRPAPARARHERESSRATSLGLAHVQVAPES